MAGDDARGGISLDELGLAARNHAMPLEALRYPLTPAGLHYLLVHYDIPAADPESWELRVEGAVARRLRLGVDEVKARPARTVTVTLECAGNGRAALDPRPVNQPWLDGAVGTAEWTGTPVRGLLEEAGLDDGAVEVVFEGADRGVEGGVDQHYARSLPVGEARRDDVLVAYAMNGDELPPQHGFPLRLLVPCWYGMASVKWLRSIRAVTTPFDGYQQTRAYVLRRHGQDPGEPLSRILPRALMIPPGVPSFLERHRYCAAEAQPIAGRAWSGWGAVTRVEFSADGGTTWSDAAVEPPTARGAWQAWSCDWTPPGPGTYELACRAVDDTGRTQPPHPEWNTGGYVNNAVQRVTVVVGGAGA